ncbi:MAG: class I SAM-dependent methyltransferase [Planctomycetes bacterium]|nr:class I SAM-dependent methyltransferase [Planctomycetota bacterium]
MAASPCLVCGATSLEPHLEFLLKCASCGFVTARLDSPTDARALYEGAYFKGEEYLDYAADEAFFKRNFRRRLTQVLERRQGGRLLEIGAAYGFFLDLARPYFDVVGFEVNGEAARFGRDKFAVDIRTDDFLAVGVDDIGGPVDVTVMWDVIEHLERPDRFIEHVAAMSKPGATLHITTGDIGSLLARLRGRKWRMIHPPTHLHYFDRRTLPRLLAKYGFRTLDVRSVGVARSFRQILYSILVLHLRRPRAYEVLARHIPPAWGFRLNTRDIMQVTAARA